MLWANVNGFPHPCVSYLIYTLLGLCASSTTRSFPCLHDPIRSVFLSFEKADTSCWLLLTTCGVSGQISCVSLIRGQSAARSNDLTFCRLSATCKLPIQRALRGSGASVEHPEVALCAGGSSGRITHRLTNECQYKTKTRTAYFRSFWDPSSLLLSFFCPSLPPSSSIRTSPLPLSLSVSSLSF